MTNFEFYKKEILGVVNEKKSIALKDNKITSCAETDCIDCKFSEKCYINMFKWLYEEHIEKPVLTSREWHLLKALETRYIARDKSGALYLHPTKPYKNCNVWLSEINILNLKHIAGDLFDFIKWEDTEPHSVEDMLMWEHEEE